MLKKLLKYDLKWCYKTLVVFYILALFFSVIVRIIESFNQSLIILILDKICCSIVISMIISMLINCFMGNWGRFVRNIYKDESYLTHTLPVNKNQIYLSKVLTAIITLTTSFIVIIACFAISSLNKDSWIALKNILEQSALYFNSSSFSLIFVMIITIFFELLFMVMSGILGIIIGHRSNNLKIVKSVVIGFAIYMAFSLITLVIIFVAGLLNSNIMTLFNSVEVSSSALKGMMLIGILVYTVYNLVICFVGNKLLNKGVNVD